MKLFTDESRSIFADDFDSSHQSTSGVADEPHPIADSFFDDPLPYLPDHFVETSAAKASKSHIDDSFDDLILDFASDLRDSKLRNSVSTKNTSSPSLVTSATSPVLGRGKTSWFKRNIQKSTSTALKPTESVCSHVSDSVVTKSLRASQPKKSRACDIGLEDLPNVSFVDDLFSDSSNSETSDHEGPQVPKVSLSKKANTVSFPEESFGDFVFSENLALPKNPPKIAPKVTAPTINAPKKSFSLSTSAKNLNNNDPKTISAEKKSSLERPLFDDEEDDLFDDISWLDSKKSTKIDNVAKSYQPNKSSISSMVSSTVPTFPPKSMSASFNSSSDFSHLQTIGESSRSRIPEVSVTEIPSEFLDDFVPASPPSESRSAGQKSKISLLNTSPILFSLKKSNRKLFSSALRTGNDKSRTPLKFDSFLDASGDSKLNKKTDIVSLEDKENEIKVVPSTPPDCDFDSILFDDIDDLFINDITSKGSKTEEVQNISSKVPKVNEDNDTSNKKVDETDPLNTSPMSPSLFDIYNYTTNKSSYVEATVTIPPSKKLELPSKSSAAPQNGITSFNNTSTPIRETPKNKISNFRKRSTPLFDESDNNFESPRPQSTLRPSMLGKIAEITSSSAAEKKKQLFSSFAKSVKQKLSISDPDSANVTRVEETKAMSRSILDSSDDDIPWLSKTSPADNSNRLACFKKPVEPSIKSRYFSSRVTPGTPGSLTDGEVANTPTPPINRRQKKKRSRLKRNLVNALFYYQNCIG